jgi:hypothetical protein
MCRRATGKCMSLNAHSDERLNIALRRQPMNCSEQRLQAQDCYLWTE